MYMHLACLVKSLMLFIIISCKSCVDLYGSSAADFKPRFRIRKSDLKTEKDTCGTAKHFNRKGLK